MNIAEMTESMSTLRAAYRVRYPALGDPRERLLIILGGTPTQFCIQLDCADPARCPLKERDAVPHQMNRAYGHFSDTEAQYEKKYRGGAGGDD
jgi:hypothetical protein